MSLADTVSGRLTDRHYPETSTADDSSTIEVDDMFHLLQTKRRRDVLRYLRDADGPVRMRDLAEQVAAWEQDTSVAALTSSERQRVYISLYQSHLPKLEAEGVIEYQQNRGIVERTPRAAQFDPLIDGHRGDEGLWARRYAAVAVLCVCVLAAAAFVPLAVDGLAVAAFVSAAFSALALAHLYSARSPL